MQWTLVYSRRKYFPQTIEGDIEAALTKIKQDADAMVWDVMTDQVDVRMNGRKIATYMAGA